MNRPRVLLVDNYDSFVGNIYQTLGELGAEPLRRRHDAVTVEEARDMGLTHLVISPGPKTPRDAGVSVAMIRVFAGVIPVLGVCLGHQAIGHAWGARVVSARELVHGKTSLVHHTGRGVLAGLPSPFVAMRYHSLALERATLPEALEVTAWTEDGEIMALRHHDFDAVPVEGVQFHPESFLSEHGRALFRNFLAYGKGANA
jgi:anthranilate synthase component II